MTGTGLGGGTNGGGKFLDPAAPRAEQEEHLAYEYTSVFYGDHAIKPGSLNRKAARRLQRPFGSP